jgi:hypothetical protein
MQKLIRRVSKTEHGSDLQLPVRVLKDLGGLLQCSGRFQHCHFSPKG